MRKFLLAAAPLVAASTAFLAKAEAAPESAPTPKRIPPNLSMALTSGSHRLLAFQLCSEEDCWHDFYVQELGLSPRRKIHCSVPVQSLNVRADVVVRGASWRAGAWPILDLKLESAHDEFVPYAASLSFSEDCRYKLQPEQPPPLAQ